jgi:hypothetical protein
MMKMTTAINRAIGLRKGVRSAIGLLLASLMIGCGPSVHLEGELVVYVAAGNARAAAPNPAAGEVEHGWFALLLDSGVERTLHFQRDPELPGGVRMEVWGDEDGHAVKVERFRLLADVSP